MHKIWTKPNEDMSQSFARIFLTISIVAYTLFFQKEIHSSYFSTPLYFYAVAYAVFTFVHYVWLILDTRALFYRRVITIIGDISILSFSFVYDSHYASFFYPLYMWIVIGNGIRFGPRYLVIAMVVGFIGFASVIFYNPFWENENLYLGLGLCFSIIVLPLFYLILIKRIHDDNQGLTNKMKVTEHQATYDFLTNIPNRSNFIETIRNHEDSQDAIALFFIDLDGFKEVNDNYGHDIGDKVLQDVSKRLKKIAGDKFFLARLGGDEFTFIIQSQELSLIQEIAQQILFSLSQSYHEKRIESISASIGIVFSNFKEESFTHLLHQSDKAMYYAKHNGKNQYYIA